MRNEAAVVDHSVRLGLFPWVHPSWRCSWTRKKFSSNFLLRSNLEMMYLCHSSLSARRGFSACLSGLYFCVSPLALSFNLSDLWFNGAYFYFICTFYPRIARNWPPSSAKFASSHPRNNWIFWSDCRRRLYWRRRGAYCRAQG